MKARYRYRIYPTARQQRALAKVFGCTRVVWNDSLALVRSVPEGEKWPSNAELQKRCITQAKRTVERAWLAEVVMGNNQLGSQGVAFLSRAISCS